MNPPRALPAPRRTGRLDPILLALVAVAAIAAALLTVKVVVLGYSSVKSSLLFEDGPLGLDHFRRVVNDPAFGAVARNTATLAVGSVAVMLFFAVPFAWLYTRTDLPMKRLLVVLLTIQIAVPGFLVAIGYVFLFNPSNGIANRFLMTTFGVDQPVFDVYGIPWIAALQGIFLVPSAFFLLVPAFQGMDSALEESATVAGVSRLRIFGRIVVPLMRPAIVSALVLYAVVSVALFDFAATLGIPKREYVFSTWIFHLTQPTFGPPDYGAASAIGMILVAAASIAVLVYFRVTRRGERFAVMTGRRGHQGEMSLGRRGRWIAWGFISVHIAFATIIPLVILVWASLLPYVQPPSADAFAAASLDAYSVAWERLGDVLGNTMMLVVVVPTLTVLLAVSLSWIATRSRWRAHKLVDVVVMGSVGVPPIVAALAFLYLGLSAYRYVPIYSTMWLMVFAFAARYISYAQRVVSGAMLQIHSDLEDAASTSGISRGRAMLQIAVPIALPAIAFAWMRVSMFSLGELTMPLMLQRPGLETVSTTIWSLQNGGRTSTAAAMGVVLVVVIGVAVLLFQRAVERWRL